MSCNFCGESSFSLLFEAESFDDPQVFFRLSECNQCKLVRTEPVLSAEQLDRWYRQEYYGGEDSKFLPLFERFVVLNNSLRAKKIYSQISKGDLPIRILDIGCGRAQLLKIFATLGCDCYGIEREGFVPPPTLDGVRMVHQPLDQIHFEKDYFDAVILWHSFEHLQQPFDILREIHRILKSNGLLVIAAPNFDSLQRRLFQKHWFHLDLPRHCYHFSLNDLSSQLGLLGFRVVRKSTYSIEQNPYGFIQSFMNWIPGTKSNHLYSLLKNRTDRNQAWLYLPFWTLLSVLLLPFALLEVLFSGIAGLGATFYLYGVKQ